VSGEGVPTVLLADHQTTGGYPKIATVISCDLDRLVQCRAGEEVAFAAVSAQEAVAIVRDHATARAAYLEGVGEVSGTLEERLMRENLIHGCINLD
jgi:allophanate hydrolase